MRKIKLFLELVLILSYVHVSYAMNPNSVKTILYNVDGSKNNIVNTRYSDGLDRVIEDKMQLPPDSSTKPATLKDRVTCTFYDNSGRARYTTKPFIDLQYAGTYLPGTLSNTYLSGQLKSSNKNDLRAFFETEYWDDPLDRIKSIKGPGDVFQNDAVQSWEFGVGKKDVTIDISVNSSTVTVHFIDGFIVSILTPDILDILTEHFYDNVVFTSPQFFLTIKKDFNGKYSQEIRDVFLRTLETRITADHSTVIQSKNDFDVLGNLLAQTAPKNGNVQLLNNTQFVYNTLGQLISKSSPDGGTIKYTYFNDGSLKFETTLNSSNTIVRQLRFTYDVMSRPILLLEYSPNITYPDNVREIATWIYDDVDLAKSKSIFKNIPQTYFSSVSNVSNRLCAVIYTNYGAKKTDVGEIFSYNIDGKLSFKVTIIEGITGFQESRYEYDVHGKITAEYNFYNGEVIKKRYTYDALGRLENVYHCVTNNGGSTYTDNLIVHNTYDDLGTMTNKSFSAITGGYNLGYTYDIRDRLSSIVKPSGKAGFEEIIGSYDKTVNLLNAQYKYYATASSLPTTAYDMSYTYDDIYRLKTVDPADGGQTALFGASFNYDHVGRFVSKQEGDNNVTGYEYYNLSSRLKKTIKNDKPGEEYVYDAYGNLVIDYTKKMIVEYDWRNLPITYRFYNTIPSGITKNPNTGSYTNNDLYSYVKSKVDDKTVQLLSTVVILYNAAGHRIGKLEFN